MGSDVSGMLSLLIVLGPLKHRLPGNEKTAREATCKFANSFKKLMTLQRIDTAPLGLVYLNHYLFSQIKFVIKQKKLNHHQTEDVELISSAWLIPTFSFFVCVTSVPQERDRKVAHPFLRTSMWFDRHLINWCDFFLRRNLVRWLIKFMTFRRSSTKGAQTLSAWTNSAHSTKT